MRHRWVTLAAVTAACAGAMLHGDAAKAQEFRPPDAPAVHFGFEPGADYQVADWDQITDYLEILARQSARVRIDTIGRSTLDRPMLVVTVSDPANLQRLGEIRSIQDRLADPRTIESEEERIELIRQGRVVVLITAAIHPTEVGSALAAVNVAYRLASRTDPATERILSESVVLIVPAINPDGVDLVADWYRSSIDMPWEGTPPPQLYHHYAGHDLNRDWYAFTQVETRNVAAGLYDRWHPQIVHDIHQQTTEGSRYFVPPWLDPIEPNVDPLLVAAANAIGTDIAWELQRQGKSGVTVHSGYDAWSPARAFAHYRGAARILSETAGARLASPIDVRPEELGEAGKRSWNQPAPWPGGLWTLADAVDYMESGSMALLRLAAEQREAWLEGFVAVGERAVAGWPEWPAAWVIPAPQPNVAGLAELLRVLQTAGVEVGVSRSPVTLDGGTYPAGSYVVSMRQPYAAFAQAMLGNDPYPADPGDGTVREPYDVTAHNLPLLYGVRAVSAFPAPSADLEPLVEQPVTPPPRFPELSGEPGVMIGLYRPWVPSTDEGWTRWALDRYDVPYAMVSNVDLRRGDLRSRFTAVVLPDVESETLDDGWEAGAMPAEYVGGLGGAGIEALREFVREGGTLVTLGGATIWALERLGLPVANRLREMPKTTFHAPGALVRLVVDTATAVGAGLPGEVAGWLGGSVALDVPAGVPAQKVAAYGRPARVLSGWVRGVENLDGAAAIVDLPLGRGRVVLFGIRPQYRGQSLATLPLFFNALRRRDSNQEAGGAILACDRSAPWIRPGTWAPGVWEATLGPDSPGHLDGCAAGRARHVPRRSAD